MIRLSRLADYGIVVMSHLARHPSRQLAAPEIAAATAVPPAMAAKILKQLVRARLLASNRGVRGGYGLARPARSITVAEVIEALDGPIALTTCVDESEPDCLIERLCPARPNWQRVNDAIRQALAGLSIDEMAHTIPPAFMLAQERPAAAVHSEIG